ncbi:hypothetical protein [Nocardia farcinica]|uniref:hypothetical protein n=1 Tax=Nocardia farcinica TaxID=37329 RepID=UPI002457F264|nr:hypothetical protein [Nocardia farcinica]
MIGPILPPGHASGRDDFEAPPPALYLAVAAALAAGAHGARMVGGGFGGSAIALVESGQADAVAAAVERRLGSAGHRAPRTFTVVPAAGAHREN